MLRSPNFPDTINPAFSDPLSSALARMKLEAVTNVALDAGGDWAIDFPPYAGLTLNVIQKGECWLYLDSTAATLRLRAGDCFLLTGGNTFTLASNLLLKDHLRAEDLFPSAPAGMVRCNGGGDFFAAGTIFRHQGILPSVLFARLPPVISIDGNADQAAVLRWSLERFSLEMRSTAIGRDLMLSHLAPIMLLQILRIYLASSPKEENWLAALSHPSLSRVLHIMQTEYRRDWSIDQFAKIAGMSRSALALKFKKKLGIAPMAYLMNWRIQIACELLRSGEQPLASIASAVGYASESAFSNAFSKLVQCRPGAYRRTV